MNPSARNITTPATRPPRTRRPTLILLIVSPLLRCPNCIRVPVPVRAGGQASTCRHAEAPEPAQRPLQELSGGARAHRRQEEQAQTRSECDAGGSE